MKKYTIFVIAIAFIALSGCTKGGGSSSGAAMVYTVNGLIDVSVRQHVDTAFAVGIGVGYTSGKIETLTLTPTNLPAGLTVTPATASGSPAFAAAFTFHANMATTGTFPVTISASSASTGTKTYTFNLVVGSGSTGTPLVYTFTGLPASITIPQYSDTTIAIPVTASFVSGTLETVSIAPGTLSSGITATATPNSGIPTFTSSVSLHIQKNTTGTFPITINTSSPSTATVAHTFNIIVAASSNCITSVVGTYNYNTVCANSLYNSNATGGVISADGVTNEVHMTTPFATLIGNLNCGAGTFTTQSGLFGADFYFPTGNGTFTPDTVILHYTLDGTSTPDTTTCTTTYTR